MNAVEYSPCSQTTYGEMAPSNKETTYRLPHLELVKTTEPENVNNFNLCLSILYKIILLLRDILQNLDCQSLSLYSEPYPKTM